jgi:hypothetical protein
MGPPERIHQEEISVSRCPAGCYHLRFGPFVFVFDEEEFRRFAAKVGVLAEKTRKEREKTSPGASPTVPFWN